nr:MAG TPA: hypothetical protein [Caudoviricetes sp.]
MNSVDRSSVCAHPLWKIHTIRRAPYRIGMARSMSLCSTASSPRHPRS